jgi:hypothetical protein
LTALPRRVPPATPPGLARRAGELRAELQLLPAETLVARTGAQFLSLGTGRGEFHLEFFGAGLLGTYPEFRFFSASGNELPDFQQTLLLYYFQTADGLPLTGNWVSFADLPGGRIYTQAFQGYSGHEVVKAFGLDLGAFQAAAQAIGGEPVAVGESAFRFQALPNLPLLLTYWLGDEDFPSACQVLFDASATRYLPIDGCAILGSQLTQKILKKRVVRS